MNYAEMTDFEINCKVARSLGEVFTLPSNRNPNPYLYVSNNTVYRLNMDGTRVEKVIVKDWCNSWADAGPLIERSMITLDASPGMWGARDKNNSCTHANPLRAAMIVFLMMREGKNADI